MKSRPKKSRNSRESYTVDPDQLMNDLMVHVTAATKHRKMIEKVAAKHQPIIFDDTLIHRPGKGFKESRKCVPCDYEGCDRDHHARGYCSTHYDQLRRGVLKEPD